MALAMTSCGTVGFVVAFILMSLSNRSPQIGRRRHSISFRSIAVRINGVALLRFPPRLTIE
jgi:hypothetical protein